MAKDLNFQQLSLPDRAVSAWVNHNANQVAYTNSLEVAELDPYSDHKRKGVIRIGFIPEEDQGQVEAAFIMERSVVLPILKAVFKVYIKNLGELEKAAIFQEMLNVYENSY